MSCSGTGNHLTNFHNTIIMKINQLYPYTFATFSASEDFNALLDAIKHVGFDKEAEFLKKALFMKAMRDGADSTDQVVFFDDDLFNLVEKQYLSSQVNIVEPMDMVNMLLGTYAGDQTEMDARYQRSMNINLLPYMSVKVESSSHFKELKERLWHNGHMIHSGYKEEFPYLNMDEKSIFCLSNHSYCILSEDEFFALVEGKRYPNGYQRILSNKAVMFFNQRSPQRQNLLEEMFRSLGRS